MTGERIVTCSIHPETGADVYVKKIKNMGLRPVFTAITPVWEPAECLSLHLSSARRTIKIALSTENIVVL